MAIKRLLQDALLNNVIFKRSFLLFSEQKLYLLEIKF